MLALPVAPLLFSWGGLLYDATIVLWLSWKRTRPLAWAVVLVFHSMTFLLFQIGMFPFIMSVATTLFFSPSWPRRLVRSARPASARAANAVGVPLPRVWILIGAMWCMFNVLLPLRTFALTDNVLWDEAGMRFSWRVMVREKSGSLTYRVTLPEGRVVLVSPYDVLSQRQVNEMIGQPDMILRLAHHLKDRFQSRCPRAVVGCSPVEVRVDALISLNGRPLRRFVDERVDLARMQDTWGRPTWILPPPPEAARSSWRH